MRRKVNLAYITNGSARRAAYKKRKKGLMKKAGELSTLCGIDACVIIFSPYNAQPELWPPSPSEVQRVASKFMEVPEMEKTKNMMNHETFLRQRIAKTSDQLKKLQKDNREKQMTKVMYDRLGGKPGPANMSAADLNDLGKVIGSYLRDVNRRMATLREMGISSELAGATPTVPMLPMVGPSAMELPELPMSLTVPAVPPAASLEQRPGLPLMPMLPMLPGLGQMVPVKLPDLPPFPMQMPPVVADGGFHGSEDGDNAVQRQQWFVDPTTPQEHVEFDGNNETILHFGDDDDDNNTSNVSNDPQNQNAGWPNPFFP